MDNVIKTQLNILIQLAEADKHFAKAEREMIFEIAKQNQVSEDAVKQLIRFPEEIEDLAALSNEQKIEYLLSLIKLMLVDKKVFDAEVNFGKKIVAKLGFKTEVVDFLITDYFKYSQNELKTYILENFS